MNEINESDCCGNGCANCVLNIKPVKSSKANKSGKQNVLQKYGRFKLINKTWHLPQVINVLDLHFKSLECDNKDFVLDIMPGYHLMMRKLTADMEMERSGENEADKERKYILRPYSPYWWDMMEMEFKILVHLIPKGIMSNYIAGLEINDEVEFRGPIGAFDYQVDLKGDKYFIIISQGVAVAPVIPLIEQILNNEEDMTRILHISCFQDLKHIYFRDKLYNFNNYWNYQGSIYLSRELCNSVECLENRKCLENCQQFKNQLKYKENINSSRFTETELKQILMNLKYQKENIYITIAGTAIFQKYFKELLQITSYGFGDNNIHLL
ncbi:NADH-cytochrome b5 reductase-like [Cochliomyia hominivorax]